LFGVVKIIIKGLGTPGYQPLSSRRKCRCPRRFMPLGRERVNFGVNEEIVVLGSVGGGLKYFSSFTPQLGEMIHL